VPTVWALGTLLVFAFGAGRALLRALGAGAARDGESLALAGAAGLGLTAVLLGVLGLAGRLEWARWLLPAGSLITVMLAAVRLGPWRPTWTRPSAGAVIVGTMLLLACAGAATPTTEFDSLAYPIPIARHLTDEGRWRFWPDQARSAFPLSQELLEVPLLQAGSLNLGLVSAVELILAAWLIVSLARRVVRDADVGWVAAIVALGCPAVAFLAASAKEDLLVVTMTMASVVSLVAAPGIGAAARVGLFAGFAAGAKYTGAPLALAVLCCVPFCCGRDRRAASLAVAGLAALAAGGLWYGVNLARFGNPIAPFAPWLGRAVMDPAVVTDWLNGFGRGRHPLDAVLAPFRMALGADAFGGRGNWVNPLAFVGVLAALRSGLRRVAWPLVAIALANYAAWFLGMQVGRLLLPSLALLSIPAADLLVRLWRRSALLRVPIGLALALSAGVVAAVGLVRAGRYVQDPSTFLERETRHYADVAWMNGHLDPVRDRVAAVFEDCGYLRVPWFSLNSTYQTGIGQAEMDDPARLRAALTREGVTYVFGPKDGFAGLEDALEPVYANPASRLGGTRFFREPLTEATAIFRVR
jgi:hypothetical protein